MTARGNHLHGSFDFHSCHAAGLNLSTSRLAKGWGLCGGDKRRASNSPRGLSPCLREQVWVGSVPLDWLLSQYWSMVVLISKQVNKSSFVKKQSRTIMSRLITHMEWLFNSSEQVKENLLFLPFPLPRCEEDVNGAARLAEHRILIGLETR